MKSGSCVVVVVAWWKTWCSNVVWRFYVGSPGNDFVLLLFVLCDTKQPGPLVAAGDGRKRWVALAFDCGILAQCRPRHV